jgi:hypothetical protein
MTWGVLWRLGLSHTRWVVAGVPDEDSQRLATAKWPLAPATITELHNEDDCRRPAGGEQWQPSPGVSQLLYYCRYQDQATNHLIQTTPMPHSTGNSDRELFTVMQFCLENGYPISPFASCSSPGSHQIERGASIGAFLRGARSITVPE